MSVSTGCARSESATRQSSLSAALATGGTTIGWGAHGLSFEPGGNEAPRRGPSAIALGPNGRVFVLDTLARRIVHVDGETVTPVVTELRADMESLAVGPDGAFAVYGALGRDVLLYGAKGQALGALKVPDVARDAAQLQLLSSHRVVVEHPFQKRFFLGSPELPADEQQTLHFQRVGFGDGNATTGYSLRLIEGTLVLLQHQLEDSAEGDQRYGEQPWIELGSASAGRMVRVVGDRAAALIETVDPAATVIDVKREVVVLDLAQRRVVLRQTVPVSSVYTPGHDIAFDGRHLAHLLPTDEGMQVSVVDVARVGGGVK